MAQRVAVLTFHHVLNFGAVLQAYALCQTLRRMGAEVELIDYRPETLWRLYRRIGRRPRTVVRNLLQRRRFSQFRRQYLPLTKRIWQEPEDLKRHPPEADTYICGSDQVWNCKIAYGWDDSFFLGFVPKGRRRVAYAGSFGSEPIPSQFQQQAAERFRQFDRLSVREQFGGEQIEALCGRQPVQVLDPTLLLSEQDYASLARKPRQRKPYIAVYGMESSDAFWVCCEQISHQLKLPAIMLPARTCCGLAQQKHGLGPREFLGWMKEAAFICTNSFHGLAFSLIFRKPFAVIRMQCPGAPQNRIDDLLTITGLNQRLVARPSEIVQESPVLQLVDYTSVVPRLDAAIESSLAYLQEAVFDWETASPLG